MDQKEYKGDKEGSWEANAMIYIRNDGDIIRVASMKQKQIYLVGRKKNQDLVI